MTIDRLRMILTDEELHRLEISQDGSDSLHIIADVHGMKCSQARRFINNIINITLQTFQLKIVHGYHHGTAIKDMLATDFDNRRIVSHKIMYNNPGVTILQLE